MVSVLFVCLANICRSPAAEGVLRDLNEKSDLPLELHVESCGLGSWSVGHLPSERMQYAAKDRGIILSKRAQQFNANFFDTFDLIFAADKDVLNELHRNAQKLEHKAKIHLITEYSASYFREDIPDPYYEGEAAFELVLDMLKDSCIGILEKIKK